MKYNFNDLSQFNKSNLYEINRFIYKLKLLKSHGYCYLHEKLIIPTLINPTLISIFLNLNNEKQYRIIHGDNYNVAKKINTDEKTFTFENPILEAISNKTDEEIEIIDEIINIELNKRRNPNEY